MLPYSRFVMYDEKKNSAQKKNGFDSKEYEIFSSNVFPASSK